MEKTIKMRFASIVLLLHAFANTRFSPRVLRCSFVSLFDHYAPERCFKTFPSIRMDPVEIKS